jgi:hypothetical protein
MLGLCFVEVNDMDLKVFLYFHEGSKNDRKTAKKRIFGVKKVVKV